MSDTTERGYLIKKLEVARIALEKTIQQVDKLEFALYVLDETYEGSYEGSYEPSDCEQCSRPVCM